MLVPASAPKFSFNRQRLLGSVLQNSVRYEADGWFAGWYVHNFDPVSLGTLTINPQDMGFPTVQDKLIPGQMQLKYYTVSFPDSALQFRMAPTQYVKWLSGSGTVTRADSSNSITITGTTSAGYHFTASVDAYDGHIISFTDTDSSGITGNGYYSGGLFHLDVSLPLVLGANQIVVRYGENAQIFDQVYAYSTTNGTTHTWGTLGSITGNTFTLAETNFYTWVSTTPSGAGTAAEQFDIALKSKGSFTIVKELETKLVGGYDKFIGVVRMVDSDTEVVDDYGDTLTGKDAVNTEFLTGRNYNPPIASAMHTSWTAMMDVEYAFPIWIKIGQLFDVKFELDIFKRYPQTSALYPAQTADYDCDLYVFLEAKTKSSSIQEMIDNLDVRWELILNGTTYDASTLPTARIRLWSGHYSRTMPLEWDIELRAFNNYANTSGFPVPYNHEWGRATFTMTVRRPEWDEIPPPPPRWPDDALQAPDGAYGYDWDTQWTFVYPAAGKPADWANPYTYPGAWPARPAGWSNPVAFPIAWPTTAAPGWANPVTYASQYNRWSGTTRPTDWANPVTYASTYNAWPAAVPTGWANPITYASSYTAAAWAGITMPADWDNPYQLPALSATPHTAEWPPRPADWTTGAIGDAQWAAVTSVFRYGVLDDYAGFSAIWTGNTATVYTAYCAANIPATWAITLPFPSTIANWTPPPWPPTIALGLAGIDALPGRQKHWFSAGTTYASAIAAAKPADWPATIAWPVTAQAGYVPYNITTGAINTTAPTTWTPPYPPPNTLVGDWPFGVSGMDTATPKRWFGTQTYDTWIQAYKPTNWPNRMRWPLDAQTGYVPVNASGANTTAPTTWVPPWPPAWPFGIAGLDTWTPKDWFSATTYQAWIQAYKPNTAAPYWPVMMNWPLTATAGWVPVTYTTANPPVATVNTTQPASWTPPWPPNWRVGLSGLPDSGALSEWFSTSTYSAYMITLRPANWPVTMEFPFTPTAGYAVRTPNAWDGVLNGTAPDNWIPPWPPQWPFGVNGPVAATQFPANEWFTATPADYATFVKNNRPATWPPAWAWTKSHLRPNPQLDTWPITSEPGWVPRTGSNPYHYTVNPVAPAWWTPDWPIYWPYGITTAPPGWYSVSYSYIAWVTDHVPFHDAYDPPDFVQWLHGWLPGYAWPAKYFARPTSAFPSRPTWQYPLVLPTTYTLYTGNPNSMTIISFNTTPPSNWPTYVTQYIESIGEGTSSQLGPDYTTSPYRYTVLNRVAWNKAAGKDHNILATDSIDTFKIGTSVNCTFPICVLAYMVYHITTTDITLCVNGTGNAASFASQEIGNTALGIKVFRLDNNGGDAGSAGYSLGTMEAYALSVNSVIPNPPTADVPWTYGVRMAYKNNKTVQFDKTMDYVWDGSPTGQLTNVQSQVPATVIQENGFYPEWIAASPGGTEFWRKYSDFETSPFVVHEAIALIEFKAWFMGATNVSTSYTPLSEPNRVIYQQIQHATMDVVVPAGQTYPWAPGVFTQVLTYNFDPDNNNKMSISTNVNTHASTITWQPNPPAPWGPSYTTTLVHETDPRDKYTLTTVLERQTDVTVSLKRAFIISKTGLFNPVTIASANKGSVTFNTPYGVIDRGSSLWTQHPGLVQADQSRTDNTITLEVTQDNRASVEYVDKSIFWYNKQLQWISTTTTNAGSTIRFTYLGTTYTLFIGTDVQSKLVYNTTDIRDGSTRQVTSLDMDTIQMAVKQFWSSDTDTENFWWVDATHVLALTKYEMQLWEKMSEVDDWMGDRWQLMKRGERANFIDSNKDLYYTVSSAFKRAGVLFKLRNEETQIRLFIINDILAANFVNPVWQEAVIKVQDSIAVPEAGVALPTDAIGAFVPVDVNELLCTSRISSTAVGTKFILAFAVSRGLQQWAIFCNPASPQSYTVINGYGHVGHNGNLTGGQYPSKVCDARGFYGTVYPVTMFRDQSDDNPVQGTDEKTFISGASLWFVYSEIQGIVSHLELSGGIYTPRIIPLSNNYHQKIERSSHITGAMFDTIPQSIGIADFLMLGDSGNNPAATALSYFSGIALPSIWYMQPILVLASLSAQGLHQAAYVNRNSLPVKSDDGKSDKDISVKRNEYTLEMSYDMSKLQGLTAFILGLIGTTLSTATGDTLKINASVDSNAVSDTEGRKFSSFATQAVMDGIATSLTTKGFVVSVKTKTTEMLQLSMFYGINDGVECWAGPGFVNHNFIGQAVSQGVATARFKLDRYGAYVPLKIIAELLLLGQQMMLQLASDIAHQLGDGASGDTFVGMGVGAPVAWIASKIALGLISSTDAALILHEYMAKALPGLYQALGDQGRGFNSGGVERNTVEPEATHVYGNKPMSMFWPAFGATAQKIQHVTVERVESVIRWDGIKLEQSGYLNSNVFKLMDNADNDVDINEGFFHPGSGQYDKPFEGSLYLPRTAVLWDNSIEELPIGMALVEGVVSLVPPQSELKNLQINCVNYTFPAPPIHDYVISSEFNIGVQATMGEIIAYSMDDTKLIDGPASNIIELDGFFGISSSYTAIEVKNSFDRAYLRPWAITPTCVALNLNGTNVVQNAKAYHGFEGQFNRIVSWKGGSGLDMATMVQQYCIIVNDHFKRSNIIPPSEFFGKFEGPPEINIKTMIGDRVANQIMDLTRQKGMDINIPGEDRDLTRYAVPVHSEMLSTLPAVVRMLAPYKLHVVEGITSLTTDVRNTQTKYKAPSSVDFNLYDTMYRATQEYVALLELRDGVVAVQDKTPSAGLSFIGATTKEAFFYSPATRMYYSFSGSGDITKRDIFNRFKDIRNGRWDFVNQEVVFKMLLDDTLFDDDVTGNFIARLDGDSVKGEIYAPNATIYNDRSDFKILSMAGGLVFQGPKRCVVNRFVITDDMYGQIKLNKKKWRRLDREAWAPGRDYHWEYEDLDTQAPIDAVYGWTHNAWRVATAMLGVSEETDCMFEWELTFAWTEQVEHVFEQDEYIVVSLAGELIGQGGTLLSRPTHLYLYKELFQNGYYTTRYTAKNGLGNRERLYIWGDGLMALEGLSLYTKEVTTRRTQPVATAQLDVQELHEQ
jgi:hypothetical protein